MADQEAGWPELFEVRAFLDLGNFLLTVRGERRWHIWRVQADDSITVVDRYGERVDQGGVEVLARPRIPRLTSLFEALNKYNEDGWTRGSMDSRSADRHSTKMEPVFRRAQGI